MSAIATKKYTHDKKKRLADKISKLKKKSDLVKIFEFIYEENQDVTENNNGVFMCFHNLSDETYMKIENYLNKEVKKRELINTFETLDNDDKKELISQSESNTQEDLYTNIEKNSNSSKFKLSNKEKIIVKRIQYDNTLSNEMKENNNTFTESDRFSENMKQESPNKKIETKEELIQPKTPVEIPIEVKKEETTVVKKLPKKTAKKATKNDNEKSKATVAKKTK